MKTLHPAKISVQWHVGRAWISYEGEGGDWIPAGIYNRLMSDHHFHRALLNNGYGGLIELLRMCVYAYTYAGIKK